MSQTIYIGTIKATSNNGLCGGETSIDSERFSDLHDARIWCQNMKDLNNRKGFSCKTTVISHHEPEPAPKQAINYARAIKQEAAKDLDFEARMALSHCADRELQQDTLEAMQDLCKRLSGKDLMTVNSLMFWAKVRGENEQRVKDEKLCAECFSNANTL